MIAVKEKHRKAAAVRLRAAAAQEFVKKVNGPLPETVTVPGQVIEELRKENEGLKAELADLLRQQRDDYRALCVSISNAFSNR